MRLKPSLTPPAPTPVSEPIPGRDANVGTGVTRFLPHYARRSVGPWVFVDRFGPADSPDVVVPPHPHTGLATVTWLVDGEGLHKDSLGSEQRIRPGEVNWMSAGRGITHSEEMPAGPTHGVQLWVALPPEQRFSAPTFEHHADLPRFTSPALEAVVFAGALEGHVAPTTTLSPLLGAEIRVSGACSIAVDSAFEHAVVPLLGSPRIAGEALDLDTMRYLGMGRDTLALDGEGRFLLIGGPPYPKPLLMWWNFVLADHDEIAAAREAWASHDARFGSVPHFQGPPRLEAPALPNAD